MVNKDEYYLRQRSWGSYLIDAVSNQIKSNLFAEKEKEKKQQDTKAGKPALTWAQQKGTIKQ